MATALSTASVQATASQPLCERGPTAADTLKGMPCDSFSMAPMVPRATRVGVPVTTEKQLDECTGSLHNTGSLCDGAGAKLQCVCGRPVGERGGGGGERGGRGGGKESGEGEQREGRGRAGERASVHTNN